MYSIQVQSIADRPLIDTITDNDFMLIGDASSGGVVKRVLISTLVEYVASQIEVTPVEPSTAQSLFLPSFSPTLDNQTDGTTYELGQQVQFARIGQITAIRYYKAASETGTHVGRIWSNSGELLASVAFADETTSGWQEQSLETPLSVIADTSYKVSVNVNEYYVAKNYSSGETFTNGDISGLAGGYIGTIGAYPSSGYANNYFRDIVFE